MVIVWEYEVEPSAALAFEAAYGPDGDWARCFRQARGFQETRLFEQAGGGNRYLTLDMWEDLDAFEAFQREHAAEYQALDDRLRPLSVAQRCLGELAPLP